MLQTNSQIKNMKIDYYNLFYTVIKTRDDDEVSVNKNDYINFNDIITPNHYIGIKPRETILRQVEKYEILDKSFQVIPPI